MRLQYLIAAATLLVGSASSPVLAEVLELRVIDAQPVLDEAGGEQRVFVRLSAESETAFSRFTQSHIKQPINILVDGKVVATPFIHEPIMAGFPLGGLNGPEEAVDLAERLRSGRSAITAASVE